LAFHAVSVSHETYSALPFGFPSGLEMASVFATTVQFRQLCALRLSHGFMCRQALYVKFRLFIQHEVVGIANQAVQTGALSMPHPLQGHVEVFTSPSPSLGRLFVLPEI
jgi:hypothetical protein